MQDCHTGLKETNTDHNIVSFLAQGRDGQIKMLVYSQAFKGKLAAYGAVTSACGKINIPRRQALGCD